MPRLQRWTLGLSELIGNQIGNSGRSDAPYGDTKPF
jgi:hypothetical protein